MKDSNMNVRSIQYQRVAINLIHSVICCVILFGKLIELHSNTFHQFDSGKFDAHQRAKCKKRYRFDSTTLLHLVLISLNLQGLLGAPGAKIDKGNKNNPNHVTISRYTRR